MGVNSSPLTCGLSGGPTVEWGLVLGDRPHGGGDGRPRQAADLLAQQHDVFLVSQGLMVKLNTAREPKARWGSEGCVFPFSWWRVRDHCYLSGFSLPPSLLSRGEGVHYATGTRDLAQPFPTFLLPPARCREHVRGLPLPTPQPRAGPVLRRGSLGRMGEGGTQNQETRRCPHGARPSFFFF